MILTDVELSKIEEYAGLFLSYEEIAILLDKDCETFGAAVKSKKSTVYKAYMKGKTMTKLEIRRKVVKMAMHGSPNAEEMVNQYITDQEVTETD